MTRALPFLLAALLSATAASAQPDPWLKGERSAPGWLFTPTVALGGSWDSNVTLLGRSNPAIAQAWSGSLNPRGEFDFTGRRTRLNFGYAGSLDAYPRLRELTRYDQRGRLEAKFLKSPRLVFVTTSSASVSPSTDRLEIGGVPFENLGATLVRASGMTSYLASSRTTVSADYQFQWLRLERSTLNGSPALPSLITPVDAELSTEATETVLDSAVLTAAATAGDAVSLPRRQGHANGAIFSVEQATTSRMSIGVTWAYQMSSNSWSQHDLRVQDAVGTLTYRLAENTKFQAGAGLSHLAIVGTGRSNFGPSIRAGFNHGLKRMTMEMAYERTFLPRWSFGGTSVSEETHANLYMPFMVGRLSLQGGAAYRRNPPILTYATVRTLGSWWTTASVGWAFARALRMEVFVAESLQHSALRGDVSRTRAGVQFVTSKPVRIQ